MSAGRDDLEGEAPVAGGCDPGSSIVAGGCDPGSQDQEASTPPRTPGLTEASYNPPGLSNANHKEATAVRPLKLHLGGEAVSFDDVVATEEPLEIRVEGRSIAVVMRTPGHDEELVAGFLATEGVIQKSRDLLEISQCPSTGNVHGNVVDVLLGGVVVNWDSLTRHVFSGSSCGVCGKATIESVFQSFEPIQADWTVSPEVIASLPGKLREAQKTFEETGGLHASGLFTKEGELLVLREDVGRHNALDKVIGHALMRDDFPLNQHVLMVSGRVSFEIMQKALAAGISVVAAISAPTSLAVQFAEEAGQTLIGFLRGETMNVYAHARRVG